MGASETWAEKQEPEERITEREGRHKMDKNEICRSLVALKVREVV